VWPLGVVLMRSGTQRAIDNVTDMTIVIVSELCVEVLEQGLNAKKLLNAICRTRFTVAISPGRLIFSFVLVRPR
jgi:hypothetical protein